MILKIAPKMILKSILIVILYELLVMENVSSQILPTIIDPSQILPTIIDPIQIACVAVGLLPIFTQYDQKKVEFLLWTRSNAGDDEVYKIQPFDETSLNSSPFDGTKKTYIFVHGYTNTGTKKWILEAKTKILNLEDANIFSLNFWELVAKPSSTDLDYPPAVCNSYKVGNFSAHVFDWMSKNSELTGSLIHIIGHSLGAHTAGVMGHYMIELSVGKVDRMTGLDPAGVLYTELINNFRLSQYQAYYIDVIHTNGCDIPGVLCFGSSEKIGHVDFYPGGGVIQPGCNNIINSANCSHERAPDLYVESIKPVDLEFISWPCESCSGHLPLFCNPTSCPYDCSDNVCVAMGFHVPKGLSGKYFLITNGESPFAQGYHT